MEKILFKDLLILAKEAVDTIKLSDFVAKFPNQAEAATRAYHRAENANALRQVSPTAYYYRFSDITGYPEEN